MSRLVWDLWLKNWTPPNFPFLFHSPAHMDIYFIRVWSGYCDQLGSKKMSEQHPLATCGRDLHGLNSDGPLTSRPGPLRTAGPN